MLQRYNVLSTDLHIALSETTASYTLFSSQCTGCEFSSASCTVSCEQYPVYGKVMDPGEREGSCAEG